MAEKHPEPGSPELDVLPTKVHQALYSFLYMRRDHPPTMREIRAHLAKILGEAPSQTDRRVRDLRDHFRVPVKRINGVHRYVLEGWSARSKHGFRKTISGPQRARILGPQRCAQCGRTPLDHHVVLVIDHKLPRHWGGDDNDDNLQPLCEECNAGKKAFYATYDEYSEMIRKAAEHGEPHGRIGELLKAFKGDWVPSELISVVASVTQYQDDWQRRTRDLRSLGWLIGTRKAKDPITGRFLTYYRAAVWEPWPAGSIGAEIRRRQR